MIPRLAMAGRLPLFAGTPLTTDRQIHALLVATSRLIKKADAISRVCRRFAGRPLLFEGLAPGGECDGVSIFDLNDMSPIEVKVDGMGAGSNSLDQTFELE